MNKCVHCGQYISEDLIKVIELPNKGLEECLDIIIKIKEIIININDIFKNGNNTKQ